jgi:hypothetical protein
VKRLAGVVLGLSLPLGVVVGCTPSTPAPLTCTAVAGAAVQGVTETVAVHSVGGARVLATAAYHHSTPQVTGTTDAVGLGQVAFPVPDAGYQVKVTVTVAKGTSRGSCATYFTPTPKAPPGPRTVACADVNFPAAIAPFGEFGGPPRHTYDIRATGTSCLVARAVGTVAGTTGGSISADGFTCAKSARPWLVSYTGNVCTNPADAGAKVTFSYGAFPTLDCPATNQVTDLTEYNSNCTFAKEVAAASSSTSSGGAYQEDGFSCETFEGNPFSYTCYTPDLLSTIYFTVVHS